MSAQDSDFWMCPPKPHRIRDHRGVMLSTGLFKVRFYGPVLADTADGMPCWFQASAFVANLKEARIAFDEWVTTTKAYIKEKGNVR